MYSFYKNGIVNSRVFLIQVLAVALGLILACIISQLDYKILARLWKFHLPITVILTLLTFTPLGAGNEITSGSDDRAWINLGFTTLQPSELLKLSFIFTFALHLSKVGTDINKPKNFLLLCLHGAFPVAIIVLQKDLGSALVFVAIFIVMMFASGLSAKFITVGLVGAVAAAPFVWNYLPTYLQQRFLVAWHPEIDKLGIGNQQYNGRIAIGSGGLNGRGLFSEKLFRVDEAYNDFIFSYIGQTLGFIGTVITVLLIMLLCAKMLITAKNAKDKLGLYICVGVFSIFMAQSIINIGMVLCAVPVIGITLPLFSSGGTSVVVSYMAIGMVMSVYKENKREEEMFS